MRRMIKKRTYAGNAGEKQETWLHGNSVSCCEISSLLVHAVATTAIECLLGSLQLFPANPSHNANRNQYLARSKLGISQLFPDFRFGDILAI